MAQRGTPSKSSPQHRKTASTKNRERVFRRQARHSFQRWCKEFDALVLEWQFSGTLKEWDRLGLPVGFVKAALFLYYCGPNQEALGKSLRSRMKLCPLAKRMNDLASELDEVLYLFGPAILPTLDRVNDSLPQKFKFPEGQRPSELASVQSKLLRVMATAFEGQSSLIEKQVAERRLAATRTLIWLFWGLKTVSGLSDNKTYTHLATLHEIAAAASGNNEKTPNDKQILQRIRRFKQNHPEEYTWIEKYWNEHGTPPEASDLFALMTFGRLLHKGTKL